MTVTIDWLTYMLFTFFKTIGCPILIGVGITVAFFRIREWIVNKKVSE